MVDAKAYTEVYNLVMSQAMTLEERLACILKTDGGKNLLSSQFKVEDVHGFNGMSGYNYWEDDNLIAQLYIGTLISGTYVIYKKTFINEELTEVYDYYDTDGNFFYQSSTLDGECLTYGSIAMEPVSPFINHLYNILYVEYEGAEENFGNTTRIKTYERILKFFYDSDEYQLSAKDYLRDASFKNIINEIMKIEEDTHLKWMERQKVFKKLREVRYKVVKTKRRAHNFNLFSYDLLIILSTLILKTQLFFKRPINNFFGTIYRYTIGNIIWFINSVRDNIGFSIAMALYAPFTFYFITQPINPHAMWAVGKVRNAYLEAESYIAGGNDNNDSLINELDELTDKVSTKSSANKKSNKISSYSHGDWLDRMSSFKAMQISYEADLVPAERFGRIEQYETQFNFPLTAEAAWMEMEMYLNALNSTIEFNKENLDRRYLSFLKSEKKRTLNLQLYIWEKMGQFFLDHPYIVVDQDNEQKIKNYYLGRQFVFFNNMTEKILKLDLANEINTHPNISALAKRYKKMKIEGSSVLDTLNKNSKLFQQKDFFSSQEHRDYMKRQWEILFLQQNKKQEAASFALQTYTWSIKNAMWLLQTIYSAKRSELGLLTYKYNNNNTGTHGVKATAANNEYLENMFHNLAMEFVSIKEEMTTSLDNDNEAARRVDVINNVKEYIIDRDRLLNAGVYASIEKEGSQI